VRKLAECRVGRCCVQALLARAVEHALTGLDRKAQEGELLLEDAKGHPNSMGRADQRRVIEEAQDLPLLKDCSCCTKGPLEGQAEECRP
jgi:hypothetical protein